MENTENPITLTTFERSIKQKSLKKNAVHESLSSVKTRRKRRKMKVKAMEEDEEDERAELEKKVIALQKIVPGGESLEIDQLFDETAGYILALQTQVKAMKVLTGFFEGLEKENSKFGG